MITSRKSLYELLSSVFSTRENGYKGSSSVARMPYMNYYFAGSDNTSADNKVSSKICEFRIELYSKIPEAEKDRSKLEKAFDSNSIFYDWDESPLNEFGAVMSTYKISIYLRKESEE